LPAVYFAFPILGAVTLDIFDRQRSFIFAKSVPL